MNGHLAAICLITLQFGACTVGEGPPGSPGSGDDAGAGGPDASSVDAPEEQLSGAIELSAGALGGAMTLGTSEEIDVVITSLDGYAGDVDLSIAGAPSSWAVSIAPSTVTLAADQSAQATVTVMVPSNGEATTAGLQVSAQAVEAAADGVAMTSTSVAVDNRIYYRVPAGTSAGTHAWPSGSINLGTQVVFINGDSIDHRIHSDNDAVGFPHQDDNLLPATPTSTYEVTITDTGSYSFYCHIHGSGSGLGSVVVE